MTEHTIIIDFAEPKLPGTLIHRVRNLAEDIERDVIVRDERA